MLAVGVWTLVDKGDYISLLNSNLYSASAYILIVAGVIVIVTGIIGCCATLRETRSLLIVVRMKRRRLQKLLSCHSPFIACQPSSGTAAGSLRFQF